MLLPIGKTSHPALSGTDNLAGAIPNALRLRDHRALGVSQYMLPFSLASVHSAPQQIMLLWYALAKRDESRELFGVSPID